MMIVAGVASVTQTARAQAGVEAEMRSGIFGCATKATGAHTEVGAVINRLLF
jgi:hypothetical protein